MVGYLHGQMMLQAITKSGMSSACTKLWYKVLYALAGDISTNMLESIKSVLPIALTVAGAVLVVTLGWHLFRNFTRG